MKAPALALLTIGLLAIGGVYWLNRTSTHSGDATESIEQEALVPQGPGAIGPDSNSSERPGPSADSIESPQDRPTRQVEPVGAEPSSMGVRGVVLDENGKPLAGARVFLREIEDLEFPSEDFEGRSFESSSREGGAFDFALELQGEFCLWAKSASRGASSLQTVSVSPREPSTRVELRLTPTGDLIGVVLDDSGRPVHRAFVYAYVDVDRSGINLPMGVSSEELFGRPTAETDEQGNFRLPTDCSSEVPFEVRAMARKIFEPTRGQLSREPSTLNLRHKVAVVHQARPGGSAVTLLLREPDREARTGSLHITLRCNNGGELPAMVYGQLEVVDRYGGLLLQGGWMGRSLKDEAPHLVIRNLEPGLRYRFTLQGLTPEDDIPIEPFIGGTGEHRAEATIPGYFRATFKIDDPKQRLPNGGQLKILKLSEDGDRQNKGRFGWTSARPEVTADLLPGGYSIELVERITSATGRAKMLSSHWIELEEVRQTFHLEIP